MLIVQGEMTGFETLKHGLIYFNHHGEALSYRLPASSEVSTSAALARMFCFLC